MLKFKITDQAKITASKKVPKKVRVVSGDPLFRSVRKDGKETEVKPDEVHYFNKSIYLRSDGETYVRIMKGEL